MQAWHNLIFSRCETYSSRYTDLCLQRWFDAFALCRRISWTQRVSWRDHCWKGDLMSSCQRHLSVYIKSPVKDCSCTDLQCPIKQLACPSFRYFRFAMQDARFFSSQPWPLRAAYLAVVSRQEDWSHITNVRPLRLLQQQMAKKDVDNWDRYGVRV